MDRQVLWRTRGKRDLPAFGQQVVAHGAGVGSVDGAKPPQQHAAFEATAESAAAAAVPSIMAQRAANARSGFVHHFITKWCEVMVALLESACHPFPLHCRT